jgi:hypothetical protein
MLFLSENRKNKRDIEKQSDELLNKTQGQSEQIIADAVKKAQAILSQAQVNEQKIFDEDKQILNKLEKTSEQEFLQANKEAKQVYQQELSAIAADLKNSQQQYLNYLGTLKSQIDQAQQANLDIVKQQTNSFFEKFEQKLSDFLTTTEQRTISSIDLEIKATKELINTYKQQQLRMLDDNIIGILEKTLSLVLAKKLTLTDQTELIYEALERAKLEKFII